MAARISWTIAIVMSWGMSTQAGTLLTDDFSYADGELQTVGSAKWARSGGTSGDLLVSGGKVLIRDTNDDDATGTLSTSVSSGNIYASFTLVGDASDRTTSTTGTQYFVSFGTSSGGLLGRVSPVVPTGTPTGSYRLGIANSSASADQILATNLTLGTAYTIVLRFDFANKRTTLWVNPGSETDAGSSATDTVSGSPTISKLGLRQPGKTNDTMGDFSFDNLLVGTSFSDILHMDYSPGDANKDGCVNIIDLLALATNFKKAGDWSKGDFNGDGFVDAADLSLLAKNWQHGVGGAAPLEMPALLGGLALPESAVPEPTCLLGVLAGLAVLKRHRTRGRINLP